MNINKLELLIRGSGKSKTQISNECGITRMTLDNILSGRDTKVSVLESLARVLQVNVGYLFDEEGGKTVTADDALKDERIRHLEEMLNEKERLIQVLLKK